MRPTSTGPNARRSEKALMTDILSNSIIIINISFYAKRPRLHDIMFLAFLHRASTARRSEETWV